MHAIEDSPVHVLSVHVSPPRSRAPPHAPERAHEPRVRPSAGEGALHLPLPADLDERARHAVRRHQHRHQPKRLAAIGARQLVSAGKRANRHSPDGQGLERRPEVNVHLFLVLVVLGASARCQVRVVHVQPAVHVVVAHGNKRGPGRDQDGDADQSPQPGRVSARVPGRRRTTRSRWDPCRPGPSGWRSRSGRQTRSRGAGRRLTRCAAASLSRASRPRRCPRPAGPRTPRAACPPPPAPRCLWRSGLERAHRTDPWPR
jgi:hypothetical protein